MSRTTDVPQKPYLGARELDQLARMQTELMSELWVLRDRVLVLEHLLAGTGVIAQDAIDEFVPDAEFQEKLRIDRDAMVGRIVGAAHRESLDLDEIKATAVTPPSDDPSS